MNKIALTGATSMLGVALIEECIKNQVNVIAIVRPNSNNIARLPQSELIDIIESDLDNIININTREIKCDAFYHLGWAGTEKHRRNDAYEQVMNIKFAIDAVHIAKKIGCHTFVGAGSQAEYGIVNHTISPETQCNPDSPYGISKYSAGKLSTLLCNDLGIRHIWARIFSVYGPYDNNETMIMYTIRELLAGRKPILTKCEQIWDFLYCDDAARALYLLGEKGKNNKVYCIGSGEGKPLLQYVEIIRDLIDPKLPLGIGEKEYCGNQVMNLKADISNLKKDTGFHPEILFEMGIKKTIDRVKSNLKPYK